jgi:hypothetical protein
MKVGIDSRTGNGFIRQASGGEFTIGEGHAHDISITATVSNILEALYTL